MAFQDTVLNGVELTRDNFTDPPPELGIVPFWFWNGDLAYDEMAWQLRQYHEKGVRSLFIHGRMGLTVPYLSDAWFDRVRFAVESARAIGIDAWVYDEMDWPSGTAGKQVLEADPDLGQRYLELVPLHFDGPLFTFLEAHDDRYVNTGNANPIAAYGVRQEEFRGGIRELVDLNKNLAWEKTIPWEAPPGKWVLLYFLEKRAPYYIDTLNPASTEKFLELTHERYKKAVGDEFGRTVPGFFTDEPAIFYYHVGLKNHVVPWSKQMFKVFRERRGYDLKPYLPALYAALADPEETVRVRYDFWRTLTEQYAETYYKRIRDWCEQNGVLFTGHLLFEEHLRLAARCEGNLFKFLEHLHLTGVDHLYPKIGTEREPDQHVALKVGSSAAHHFGSVRLLCESMGGTYWNCTLARMKWMNNWEYVLGVNLFNNHGYHYTIEGERKRDWPPSQFYHHTWWKYYDRFTTYNARLSHLLSGGRHVAGVLMLYPIASIWANYMPQERTRVGDVIEADFQYLTDTLLRLHYDFDYVDEDVLARAEIADGTITIRDEAYRILLLPPVTHIKESTYCQIQAFLASGGHVIADTLLPIGLLEVRGNGQVDPLDNVFDLDPKALLAAFDGPEQLPVEVVHREEGAGHVFFFKGSGLYNRQVQLQQHAEARSLEDLDIGAFFEAVPSPEDRERIDAFRRAASPEARKEALAGLVGRLGEREREKREALRRVLHRCAAPDVTISDDQVFYLHRIKDGFDLYFFVNTSQEDRGRVTVTFERVARPERWNPNTGAVRPMPMYRVEDGRLVVELDFPPGEAHVVALGGDAGAPHVTGGNLSVASFDGETLVGYAGDVGETVEATVAVGGRSERVHAEARPARPPITLPSPYAFDVEQDNVLVIERWKMKMEEDGAADGYHLPGYDASGWLDVTNGAWEMQLPQERDAVTYPVVLWYRTHFDVQEVPPTLRLLIDGFSGREHRLFVNGEEVADRGTRCWLDAEIRAVDIAPLVREGRNTVVVRLVVTRRTDGILDLLKIVGDFALAGSREAGFVLAARTPYLDAGDWTTQGYPFFSGTGVYRAEVEVPAAYLDGGRLFLEADCGEDVLEVSVDGSEGRVAPWHPYRLEVTDLVAEGRNTIAIKVTNTLINILEGVPQPSGLFDLPRIVHEHRYELRCV